jgi:lysophospholipase
MYSNIVTKMLYESKHKLVTGGVVYVWTWEAEEPRATIVMVHGAAEHHGRYGWLIEMWRSENFNVVMGDLPGQGTSTRRRGHIDSFDQYIETVESWVKEAERFSMPIFLLGHSMGGLTVIRTLQEKQLPVKAAILSSPCLGLVEPPPKGLEWISKGLNIFVPSLRVDSHLEVGIATRNQEVKDEDENDSLYVRKVSIRWYQELVKSMRLAYENIDKFPDIPVLIFQAGDDKIVDKVIVREWFDKLHTNEKMYKEWAGLYHEVFNEPERDLVFNKAKLFVEMSLTEYNWGGVNKV